MLSSILARRRGLSVQPPQESLVCALTGHLVTSFRRKSHHRITAISTSSPISGEQVVLVRTAVGKSTQTVSLTADLLLEMRVG